jgi:hypothetical protein
VPQRNAAIPYLHPEKSQTRINSGALFHCAAPVSGFNEGHRMTEDVIFNAGSTHTGQATFI